MSRILTIDQGTTSSRSIIFDINGDIEQVAQEEYPLIFPNDGWVEIDPDALYKSVTNTLNQLDLEGVKFGGITNQREIQNTAQNLQLIITNQLSKKKLVC